MTANLNAYSSANALSALTGTAVIVKDNGGSTITLTTANKAKLFDGRLDSLLTVGAQSTSISISIDLGAATSLAGWAMLNSNIASATAPTITIISSAASDYSSPTTNKAATTPYTVAPRAKDHLLQHAALSKRYWQIQLAWTGSFNFSCGELFAFSSLTELSRHGIYGQIGEREDLKLASLEMQFGETRALKLGGPVRSRRLGYADLNATARNELLAMWRATNGPVTPLLWAENTGAGNSTAATSDEQNCIYGRLDLPAFDWTESDYVLYQPSGLVIRSLGREAGN